MITLFTTNTHKDNVAKRIFHLFGISYEETEGSTLAESLGPYYSPIIRDDSGICHYGDSFFVSNIKLYSLGETCPNCCILEGKLREAEIPFVKITDRDVFKKMGFTHFPVLTVSSGTNEAVKEFGYKEAFKMIKDFISGSEADV